MVVRAHLTEFAGYPVAQFWPDQPLPDVDGTVAWRVAHWDFDDDGGAVEGLNPGFRDTFDRFLERVDAASVRALVIGSWGYAAFNEAPIDQLAAAAGRLTGLEALFLGDILSDECELSWIKVGAVSRLLDAYPRLRVLRVRGSMDKLSFEPVRHAALRILAFETGGLGREILTGVVESDLPSLEQLELWLGVGRYGGDITIDDLAPLLSGTTLPGLRRLGLRNAEIADQLAAAVAAALVVVRLAEVDLSLGVLGDEGAAALLGGQPLTHLRRLDLHHHFLSEAMAARLVVELPGVDVDVSDRRTDEEWGRFTAVSE